MSNLKKHKKISANGYLIAYYEIDKENEIIFINTQLNYYRHIVDDEVCYMIQIIENVKFNKIAFLNINI